MHIFFKAHSPLRRHRIPELCSDHLKEAMLSKMHEVLGHMQLCDLQHKPSPQVATYSSVRMLMARRDSDAWPLPSHPGQQAHCTFCTVCAEQISAAPVSAASILPAPSQPCSMLATWPSAMRGMPPSLNQWQTVSTCRRLVRRQRHSARRVRTCGPGLVRPPQVLLWR